MRAEKLSILIALTVAGVAALLIVFVLWNDQGAPGDTRRANARSTANSTSFEELRELMRTIDPSLTDDEIRAFFFQEENERLVPNLARVIEYVQTHGVKEPSGSKSSRPSPELRRFLTLIFQTDAGVSPEEAESRVDEVFQWLSESVDVDEILKRIGEASMEVETTTETRLQ